MKKLYITNPMFLLLFSMSIGSSLQSQNFNLIDVNKIASSYPTNVPYSGLDTFAEMNGIFYFSADDGIHGAELWSSDGTTAGTKLVKDITPGKAASSPHLITTSGTNIYLVISNNYSEQLWISDGTNTGTKEIFDASVVDFGAYLHSLTDVNGTLYFILEYDDWEYYHGHSQLWKSDGTEAGTIMVSDLWSLGNFEYVWDMVNVNGQIFFTADGSLCISDGTTPGTRIIGYYDYPVHLTALNGLLYFSPWSSDNGPLWVSNGTKAGTPLVKNDKNIHVGTFGYSNTPFTLKGNVLFFQGGTEVLGYELY